MYKKSNLEEEELRETIAEGFKIVDSVYDETEGIEEIKRLH